MTLKNIEINSFKSFGKKSLVSFTASIVAVVGPNGSGKSNIVEAIRFVLGEQSMKSLRGKGGVDLIFKGSKMTSQASKAFVSITFDNSKKIFSFTSAESQDDYRVSLDYDEVTISREIFQDGTSRYLINGTEVRLKDVVDLLSSVNIGSSGHHIISQGEADRVLSASLKDRRFMIEDALGLKIYQYRIKESERKLEKTLNNMKEVMALRREVAPHLNFLKKQVEKVEKIREFREDLRNLYQEYLSKENLYIDFETKKINHEKHILDERILSFDDRIGKIQEVKNSQNIEGKYLQEIKNNESEIYKIRNLRDDLARKLGRIEGMIEGIEKSKEAISLQTRIISGEEWQKFIKEIDKSISKALEIDDLPSVLNILRNIKSRLNSFSNLTFAKNFNKENSEDQEMQKVKEKILIEIQKIENEEKHLLENIKNFRQKNTDALTSSRDNEKVLYELLNQKNTTVSEMHSLSFREEKLNVIKNNFDIEVEEAKVLIGQEVDEYLQNKLDINPEEIVRQLQENLRKKIERIKIKLEDVGIGNGADIIKEYEETEERDIFLANELEDLNKGIQSLRILIQDLKETLDKEFKSGVEKINKQFQEFFSLMFGGGSAFLSITMENKKGKKDELIDKFDKNMEIEEESELGFERGIDINVTLPQKKVKDLHMLSGGERSLVSIALLFAISQVNPPPFLVLDETDAALDEANSRKYASMLENLSGCSQLIVVTHNRETMSIANILYGVTMGADGTSKLLSIKLEDATTYAK